MLLDPFSAPPRRVMLHIADESHVLCIRQQHPNGDDYVVSIQPSTEAAMDTITTADKRDNPLVHRLATAKSILHAAWNAHLLQLWGLGIITGIAIGWMLWR